MKHTLAAVMLLGQLVGTGAAAASAGAVDYESLVTEIRSLKDDADVVSYLSRNAVEAQRLSTLQRTIERSLTLAREYQRRAEEERQRQQLGSVLAGHPMLSETGKAMLSGASDPVALGIKAAKYKEDARDAVVNLALGYRDIKARAVAQKEAAARPNGLQVVPSL